MTGIDNGGRGVVWYGIGPDKGGKGQGMTTATEAWQAWQAARAARAEARARAQQSVITGRPIGERISAFAAEEQALKAAEAARREYYAIIGIA